MKSQMESPEFELEHTPGAEYGSAEREAVLHEAERVLSSRFFKSANRCRQFLSYVVEHRLHNRTEQLKERTIGTEVFQRPVGYATGEDPVVRVQAGEVRRRLEQYYQSLAEPSSLRIELPLGSYSPVFHWSGEPAQQPHTSVHTEPVQKTASAATAVADLPHNGAKIPAKSWLLAGLGLVVIAAGVMGYLRYRSMESRSVLEQFWGPVLASRQPILICMAKPVAYRPTEEVYRRYSKEHPGTFQSEAERTNEPLPLDPDQTLKWSDFFIYRDFGIASGDVHAAVSLATIFGKYEKPYQLRIGSGYGFEDLRNSPAAVIGGFNNRWTMQLIANQRFTFTEDHARYLIREQIQGGRTWATQWGPKWEPTEDYAIVSRMIDSTTGQFTIVVAGITSEGTQAAGEFVSSPRALEAALATLGSNWQQKNVEFVLKTTVTDSVAGPPIMIAGYAW